MVDAVLGPLLSQRQKIEDWLSFLEGDGRELPLYHSTDIRDAGYKLAVVDTNLFPSGFNNLSRDGARIGAHILKDAIESRHPGCRRILLVIEEHTRNKWYLENVFTLKQMIEMAGFELAITTSVESEPALFNGHDVVELETQLNHTLELGRAEKMIPGGGATEFDLIILNNDLIRGIPELLMNASVPVYPSMEAGWHSRLKSSHFEYARQLIEQLGGLVGVDPWLLSADDASIYAVDINEEKDRERLYQTAGELYERIAAKYKEHGVDEKPFLFVKADYGTYGMGVMPLHNIEDIRNLNRKNRNRLFKGKGSSTVRCYLLQEGVPSNMKVEGDTAELCLYQMANRYMGSFYRVNYEKSDRDNLNSRGMHFRAVCHDEEMDCGTYLDKDLLYSYQVISRIAGIASMREIEALERGEKNELCLPD